MPIAQIPQDAASATYFITSTAWCWYHVFDRHDRWQILAGRFRLWKPDNKPKIIENERFFLQKLHYIHDNPVRKSHVEGAECWKWSSANPDCPIEVVRTWQGRGSGKLFFRRD